MINVSISNISRSKNIEYKVNTSLDLPEVLLKSQIHLANIMIV